MAILGLFTDVGIQKSIEAANDGGFFVFPEEFGVSDQAGSLDSGRTSANIGLFHQAAISSRVVVDQNTVKIIGTVPPGLIPEGETKEIREVYLFAKDSDDDEFLLALGQPTTQVIYDPTRSVTLELEMSLTNIDLTENFIFAFTQATEISEHNTDPNAHPEIIEEMNRAGQFLLAGGQAFDYAGQSFDKFAEFEGTKSTVDTTGAVVLTWTATYNGNELNAIDIVFDGVKDADTVRAEFNATNFPFTVEHDGVGTEVVEAQSATLLGGTYSVSNDDVVYRDTDGIYKQAVADGSIKSQVAGIASIDNRLVMTDGLVSITTGFTVGSNIFLSDSNPGEITDSDTAVKLGVVMDDEFILFRASELVQGLFQSVDAVVSDIAGFNFFETTQEAIDSVPDNGYILVDKLEELEFSLDSSGKTLNFLFNGVSTGWQKAAGVKEIQLVTFSSVPDEGTWRIEWNGQESADLAFDADAQDVEDEFNLFAGHNGVSVTGNYSIGFTFTFDNDFLNLPEPTFANTGEKEQQRFSLGNIPDDGTWQFQHDAELTGNHAFNDNAAQLETLLEALSSIDDVTVSGSFATQQFDIEFEDLSPQNKIYVTMSNLEIEIPQETTLVNTVDPSTLSVSSVLGAASGSLAITSNSQFRSMSFTPNLSGPLTSVDLYLSIGAGSPTGDVTLEIRDDNSGDPGSVIATSETVDVGSLPASPQNFKFLSPLSVVSATKYHMVLNTNAVTFGGGQIDWDFETNGSAGEASNVSADSGSSWGSPSATDDLKHEVRLGIEATVINEGKYPANNLLAGGLPLDIDVAEVQRGSPLGPTTAIVLDAPDSQFIGKGLIDGFDIGIDLGGQSGVRVDLQFENTAQPILSEDLEPGVDFNFAGSIGFTEDQEGQLRVLEHPSNKNRVIITGADKLLSNGTIKIQQLNGLRLRDFEGAQIDFSTGEIFADDGTTPLGIDFTPPTIATGLWRWHSISIVPDSVVNGAITAKLAVTVAASDGATPDAAIKAPLISGAIGAVAVQEFPGLPEISEITTVADNGGDLGGKYFVINAPGQGYYVWYDVDNSSADPAPGGGLVGVEVDINSDDPAASIAAATQTELDGLGDFSAAIQNDLVTVTNAAVGTVTDIADGAAATGFAFNVFQQGQDIGGVTPISATRIEQLPANSGGAVTTILTEVPSGTVDGVNTDFDVTVEAESKDLTWVFVNGVYKLHSEYTLSGTTFTITDPPAAGQKIEIKYAPDPVALAGGSPPSSSVDLDNIDTDPAPDTDGGRSLGTAAKGWNELILKDKTTGDKYRVEIDNGTFQAVLIP